MRKEMWLLGLLLFMWAGARKLPLQWQLGWHAESWFLHVWGLPYSPTAADIAGFYPCTRRSSDIRQFAAGRFNFMARRAVSLSYGTM